MTWLVHLHVVTLTMADVHVYNLLTVADVHVHIPYPMPPHFIYVYCNHAYMRICTINAVIW